MSTVWIVVGWFGGEEWIESVHATEAGADKAVAALWAARRSATLPADDYRQGHCKFGADRHEVLP